MPHLLPKEISISPELSNLITQICGSEDKAINAIKNLADIVRKFSDENNKLLNERVFIQQKVDDFFLNNKDVSGQVNLVVANLKEIGFIEEHQGNISKNKPSLPDEITPKAGPQLVVPADKANMVLNAANARWGSLYNALYSSNIIDSEIVDKTKRRALVTQYANDFLDKIASLAGDVSWNEIESFIFSKSGYELKAISKSGAEISLNEKNNLVGINLNSAGDLEDFLLENNGLKIEVKLDESAKIIDVILESTLTYIIDLEDASISAPANKYESYRIIKGLHDGTLECEVRGVLRKILPDTNYLDPQTLQQKTLKRTALPLVRDVGPHMLADKEIIAIDGQQVPEKILDIFITSLIGMRFHVAPKMHGAKEVEFNVRLLDEINKAQNLPRNANKIGIMNEELRTCAQLANCIEAAGDIIFFTNTGFLDYTGSFIDLMMYAGPISPYRNLAAQTYKTEYEKHNVNISLAHNVPQIGAGMWAAIYDMAGLLKSKEAQVKGLTDTGWSPSPSASTIHAMAFHIFGDVRQMQQQYSENIKDININDLFVFPKADLGQLSHDEIILNLNFAVHGLIAYAEPWVRRGVGCSGVKDLSGVALMEDRATARIKAAFIRNWLLHQVITEKQVEESISQMTKFVDEQNAENADYQSMEEELKNSGNCPVINAVRNVIFNPYKRSDSYVEPYFYEAYLMNNRSDLI